jgi:hypothetical protein
MPRDRMSLSCFFRYSSKVLVRPDGGMNVICGRREQRLADQERLLCTGNADSCNGGMRILGRSIGLAVTAWVVISLAAIIALEAG